MASGLFFGLAAIKPHLLLLVPVAMIMQQRWRMLAGFAITGVAEALISLALGRWSGAKLYVTFLSEQRKHLSPHPERMLNIDSLMLDAGVTSDVLKAVGMLGMIVFFYVACRHAPWWRALAAATTGTRHTRFRTLRYGWCSQRG